MPLFALIAVLDQAVLVRVSIRKRSMAVPVSGLIISFQNDTHTAMKTAQGKRETFPDFCVPPVFQTLIPVETKTLL